MIYNAHGILELIGPVFCLLFIYALSFQAKTIKVITKSETYFNAIKEYHHKKHNVVYAPYKLVKTSKQKKVSNQQKQIKLTFTSLTKK